MSYRLEAVPDCTPATLAMIERQARAWIENDYGLAAPDWHPEGVLVAPGHRVPAAGIGREIEGIHRDYRDLSITVVAAFESPGGWVGIEWLWDITRRADGRSSRTHDAIVVERRDGLIVGWREYFDTHGSVEAHHG